MFNYISNPEEIYKRSFSEIRQLAEFGEMSEEQVNLSVRLIHACGIPEITRDLRFSSSAINCGLRALEDGKSVFVDAAMVKAGIIRRKLKFGNKIICTLNKVGTANREEKNNFTRSAAAVDLWQNDIEGCICVFGNAPTALFRLLELINLGGPRPALILAFPVGFVGAAEAKQAVIDHSCGVPYITLLGRLGGSAIASASVNALNFELP